MKKHLITLATLAALAATVPAHAQFGGFKNPLAGGGGSGQTVDAAGVKKSVAAALSDLAAANGSYAAALGNETKAAELMKIAGDLKNGSLGVDSKVINTVKELSASSVADMKAKQEAKEKVSADGKKKLVEGLGYHVSGTAQGVAGVKQLKAALESKSPTVLASLASLKDFPALFGQWTSATGGVLSYMKFNGVDTAGADKAISASMKD
jgi:hypothetical protein